MLKLLFLKFQRVVVVKFVLLYLVSFEMFLMSFTEFYKQCKTSQYDHTAMFLHEFRVPETKAECKHGDSKTSCFHDFR